MGINLTNGTIESVADGTIENLLKFPANFSNPDWPAFHAYRDDGHISSPSTTTVVFNGTRLNNGSHYDTSTGIFTAPIDGIYWFHCYSMDYNGGAQLVNKYFGMVKNNTRNVENELRCYTSSSGAFRAHRTGGNLYNMDAGDTMRVITINATMYGTSYVYLYFDGALIA